jgi:hypothetical protein
MPIASLKGFSNMREIMPVIKKLVIKDTITRRVQVISSDMYTHLTSYLEMCI